MALNDRDREEIREMLAEVVGAGQHAPPPTEVMSFAGTPRVLIAPIEGENADRSRYLTLHLLDEEGFTTHRTRLLKSDLRNFLISAFTRNRGEMVPRGAQRVEMVNT